MPGLGIDEFHDVGSVHDAIVVGIAWKRGLEGLFLTVDGARLRLYISTVSIFRTRLQTLDRGTRTVSAEIAVGTGT